MLVLSDIKEAVCYVLSAFLLLLVFLVTPYFYFFLGGTIASLTALDTRNFTTFLAGILMASPVAGLRPMRALRSTRTSRPMPGRTVTPFFLVSAIAVSAYAVVNALATLAGTPTISASFLISCDCVIFAAAILLLFEKS